MSTQRRLNPRLAIRLPARYKLEGVEGFQEGTIRDLGAGGAAILTKSEIPSGSQVSSLSFALPSDSDSGVRIEITTSVAVHSRRTRDQGQVCFLSGLQFVGLDPRLYERLRSFVMEVSTASADPV